MEGYTTEVGSTIVIIQLKVYSFACVSYGMIHTRLVGHHHQQKVGRILECICTFRGISSRIPKEKLLDRFSP